MFDGSGLGVSDAIGDSVNVSVGVIEVVCVALGTKDVFVTALVKAKVGAIGVDVNVQANDVTIQKINKRCFRLMREILLYPNDTDVRKFRERNKDPRPETGIIVLHILAG